MKLTCPECGAKIQVEDLEKATILPCPECSMELEVTRAWKDQSGLIGTVEKTFRKAKSGESAVSGHRSNCPTCKEPVLPGTDIPLDGIYVHPGCKTSLQPVPTLAVAPQEEEDWGE